MKNRKVVIILYLLLIVSALLFFSGGPDYYSPRSSKRIWDLGHVFFYTILSLVLLQKWNFLKNQKPFSQLFWLIVITLSSGVLVELIQIKFARLTEAGDLWRDFLGCLIGWAFFGHRQEKISPGLSIVFRLLVILALLLELYPPLAAIIDEVLARRQFPILSSFETPFETERWEAEGRPSRTTEAVFRGKYACRMTLSTEEYSGFSLKYFPGDWEGYDTLYFALYNPLSVPLPVTCRIHDWQHIKNNEPYQDRYNKRVLLKSGWNQILIPLEKVRYAPSNRRMQLSRIINFGIFATRLSEPMYLCIDEVKLK